MLKSAERTPSPVLDVYYIVVITVGVFHACKWYLTFNIKTDLILDEIQGERKKGNARKHYKIS